VGSNVKVEATSKRADFMGDKSRALFKSSIRELACLAAFIPASHSICSHNQIQPRNALLSSILTEIMTAKYDLLQTPHNASSSDNCCISDFFFIVRIGMGILQDLVEGRDKGLGEPEGEGELGAGHEKLGEQALEEGSHALVLDHVGDDTSAGLFDLEVAVLDAGLDDVERCGDNERSGGTGDGSDEVLAPAGAVVVLELVKVLLGCGRATEQSE
jgi:hypothetical protein